MIEKLTIWSKSLLNVVKKSVLFHFPSSATRFCRWGGVRWAHLYFPLSIFFRMSYTKIIKIGCFFHGVIRNIKGANGAPFIFRITPATSMPAAYDLNYSKYTVQKITNEWKKRKIWITTLVRNIENKKKENEKQTKNCLQLIHISRIHQ